VPSGTGSDPSYTTLWSVTYDASYPCRSCHSASFASVHPGGHRATHWCARDSRVRCRAVVDEAGTGRGNSTARRRAEPAAPGRATPSRPRAGLSECSTHGPRPSGEQQHQMVSAHSARARLKNVSASSVLESGANRRTGRVARGPRRRCRAGHGATSGTTVNRSREKQDHQHDRNRWRRSRFTRKFPACRVGRS